MIGSPINCAATEAVMQAVCHGSSFGRFQDRDKSQARVFLRKRSKPGTVANLRKRALQLGNEWPQELELIAPSHKNYDGDREVGNRLLVAQTLVGSDKHIELVRGEGRTAPFSWEAQPISGTE